MPHEIIYLILRNATDRNMLFVEIVSSCIVVFSNIETGGKAEILEPADKEASAQQGSGAYFFKEFLYGG